MTGEQATASYALQINGRKVDLGGAKPEASLDSIRVVYEQPRELRFRWKGQNILGQTAKLTVDDVVRFEGKVLCRRRAPNLADRDLSLTALGWEEEARGIDLRDSLTHYPLLGFSTKSMREILERIITQSLSAELQAAGIVAEFAGATEEVVPNFQARGWSLADTLSMLTDAVPGFTWFIDPATRVFRIVNVFAGEDLTVTLGRDVVSSRDFDLTEDLRNRYTAVRLIGKADPSLVATASELVPAWKPELESTWSADEARMVGQAKDPAPEDMRDVFRKFSFEDFASAIVPNEEIRLVQQAEEDSYFSVAPGAVDWANSWIWAKEPACKTVARKSGQAPNMRVPGKAKAPKKMYLVYKALGPELIPGFRVPFEGFTGTAFTAYGIAREKVVWEPNNEDVTIQRALRLLEVLKDVNYEGRIPLAGDVPEGLWNLNRRINLAVEGGVSGYENARMILRGFEHSFKQARTMIEVGSDKSLFLGENAN